MKLFSCMHAILHHRKPAARTKIEAEAVRQKKIAQEGREMQDLIQELVPMVRTMLESSIHDCTYATLYEQLVLRFPEAAQSTTQARTSSLRSPTVARSKKPPKSSPTVATFATALAATVVHASSLRTHAATAFANRRRIA